MISPDMLDQLAHQRTVLVAEGEVFQRMGFDPGVDIKVVCQVPHPLDPTAEPEWYWTPAQ